MANDSRHGTFFPSVSFQTRRERRRKMVPSSIRRIEVAPRRSSCLLFNVPIKREILFSFSCRSFLAFLNSVFHVGCVGNILVIIRRKPLVKSALGIDVVWALFKRVHPSAVQFSGHFTPVLFHLTIQRVG